jgi:hypothetical protein
MTRGNPNDGQLRFDPADVAQGTETSSSGRRRARDSRSNDTRTVTLRLQHVPTGIVLQGVVPQGHYSRNQLREITEQLRSKLLKELEPMVLAELKRRRSRKAT